MQNSKQSQIKQLWLKGNKAFCLIFDKARAIWNLIINEELGYYAASLSFYTIFAIVPILLIFFSIFLNLPTLQSQIEEIRDLIISNIMPTHTEMISDYLDTFMQNSSTLGMLGLIYALFASIMFFRNYEYIAAKMFSSKPRGLFDSFVIYWTMTTLFPVVLAFSIYFSGEVQKALKGNADLSVLFDFLPYLLTWALFFLIFKISANKKLNLLALVISTILTTATWLLLKWGFVYYVFYNQTYKNVYGSISIFLFMMLWIYVSWFVILCGMRVCESLNNYFSTTKKPLGIGNIEI